MSMNISAASVRTPKPRPSAALRETLQTKHQEMVKNFRGNKKQLDAIHAEIAEVTKEKDALLKQLDDDVASRQLGAASSNIQSTAKVEKQTAEPAMHAKRCDTTKKRTVSASKRNAKSTENTAVDTPQVVNAILEINDRLDKLRRKIKDITENSAENKYYIDNGELIFHYFQDISDIARAPASACLRPTVHKPKIIDIMAGLDSYDDEADDDEGEDDHGHSAAETDQGKQCVAMHTYGVASHREAIAKRCDARPVTVLDFFGKKTATPTSDAGPKAVTAPSKTAKKPPLPKKSKKDTGLEGFVQRKEHSSRGKLLEKYMSNIDPSYTITIEHADEEDCPYCGNDMLTNPNEGIAECMECGFAQHVGVDTDKRSYKEASSNDAAYCVYKRINHFREILAMVRGYSSSEVPQHVFDVIWNEIRKNRITDLSTITLVKVREWLKKNKLSQYYECIGYIMSRLHPDCAPAEISKEDEERLCTAFMQIQGPFAESPTAKIQKRKNFCSYAFVLSKLSKMFGMTHMLPQLPMLKSIDKIYVQEKIWSEICESLGWENMH